MDNQRSRYLTLEEERRLLAALEGQPWLWNLVTAAIHTGMRRGELFKLRWFNVDFNRGVIHVRDTKTNKNRDVPMNAEVRGMLEEMPKSSAHVFPSPKTGRQLVDIKNPFGAACEAAGISDLRFHDLRHTAATRLADAGVNVVVIADILGHGDIRTTKRYSHAMEESKREAVETLAVRQKRVKKQKRQARQPTAQVKNS